MRNLPNMGLVAWDQLEDKYLREQLAGNFARLDYHDHSPGKGKQIGTAGIEEGAITAPLIAEGAITSELFASTVKNELPNLQVFKRAEEEERNNTAYGLLPHADEVTVTVPTNGLIAIAYQATWKESVNKKARAAIFIGANQLKQQSGSTTAVQETGTNDATENVFLSLATWSGGLASSNTNNYTGDVTTGQLIGTETEGNLGHFGIAYAFAAAGTYKITVQFKSITEGIVKVKNRNLWAWTMG